MKTQHAIALLLLSLISTAANSAEYQFRKNLDGALFAKNPDNGGTKPVEPTEPEKPEFDISPWQNVQVSLRVFKDSKTVLNNYHVSATNPCPYEPGLPQCITSKQNDIDEITLNGGNVTALSISISTNIPELSEHIDSVTFSTKNGVLKCSNFQGIYAYSGGTYIECLFDRQYDFLSYMEFYPSEEYGNDNTRYRVNAIMSLNKKTK